MTVKVYVLLSYQGSKVLQITRAYDATSVANNYDVHYPEFKYI